MHPFLKTMFYLGVIALVCSIVGAVCYPYSININPIVDNLCVFGLIGGFLLSLIVLLLLGCSFLYFLIRRKFKQVGFCIIPCLLPILAASIIMPPHGVISPKGHRVLCSLHVKHIGQALIQYTNENNGTLPSKWCDALMSIETFNAPFLRCGNARLTFKEGESSYALNEAIIEQPLSKMPSDTVILFETDFLGDNGKNKVGGIDILTCSYHAGLGCNILFADGHVEFVKKKDIPNLRWKP